MHRFPTLALAIASLPLAPIAAQERPIEPDGAPLPRYLTPAEARYLESHPLGSDLRAVTPPPPGPIHCVAEYEPMAGILIAWEGWTTILVQMAAQITTVGEADLYVAVDSAAEGTSALNSIAAGGADMARVHTMVVTTDSVWIRDYGPRYVYQGDVRSIVDHTYNRPRPNDNVFPTFFAGYIGHAFYEHQLVHGGGNFHLDALDSSFVARLINNENTYLTEQQIYDIWWDFQHVATTFFTPLPSYIDATQHIDMWLQVVADDIVVISDWPLQSGSTQDQLCEAAAVTMAGRGYTVFRTPAHPTGGVHYTYTNVVMCNDLVLIPSYTNSTVQQFNAPALATWQQACPTRTVVAIDSQAIVSAAGVLHCIVMHLPVHRGGVDPTAYLIFPAGGEALEPGTTATIEWLSDDDEEVSTVDLLLSTDGGASFPTTIAAGLAPMGSYDWVVPVLDTTQARVRVLAHDGTGRSGSDDSDGDFTISATPYAALLSYGTGKAGSLGVPLLDAPAPPVLGSLFTLGLSRALPNGDAYFIYGVSPDSYLFDGATVLVDYFAYFQLPIDAAGAASLPILLPVNPNLAGLSFFWQAWIPNDPHAAGAGWAASNGLETRLGF
ncbi:MAG: agmatine deiminase family protein [Planctomycetota bacterium]